MGDTGREVLRKDVKVRGWILFGIFSVIFVFMIITICSMIHNGEFELNSFTGPLIFLTVISVICIWDGIRMISMRINTLWLHMRLSHQRQ